MNARLQALVTEAEAQLSEEEKEGLADVIADYLADSVDAAGLSAEEAAEVDDLLAEPLDLATRPKSKRSFPAMGGADWTARALLDLQRQLDRVAASNPVAADRLSGEVERVVALIADQPGLGFRGHRPEVRIALARRHRYRIVDQPTP